MFIFPSQVQPGQEQSSLELYPSFLPRGRSAAHCALLYYLTWQMILEYRNEKLCKPNEGLQLYLLEHASSRILISLASLRLIISFDLINWIA